MTKAQKKIASWKKKIPMFLTWSRVAICPLLAFLIEPQLLWPSSPSFYDQPIDNLFGTLNTSLNAITLRYIFRCLAAGLFILAAITDWLDGIMARLYQVESNIGRFMDPIADKILVTTALIMMIPSHNVHPVLVILLLSRDLFIGGIRSAAASDGLVIAAATAGKWKTGLQMVAIPLLLIPVSGTSYDFPIGNYLMWFSVILSLWSGAQYVVLFQNSLANRKKEKL